MIDALVSSALAPWMTSIGPVAGLDTPSRACWQDSLGRIRAVDGQVIILGDTIGPGRPDVGKGLTWWLLLRQIWRW